MPHAHVCVRVHLVFSTKERRPLIPQELQHRLWAYLGTTANNLELQTFAIGGMPDHVHALIGLPGKMAVATAAQKLKANSSRWISEVTSKRFAWQEGYSAFSVSLSQMEATAQYIRNQQEHHKKRSFDEELSRLLRLHGFEQ